MKTEDLFWKLYGSRNETEVDHMIRDHPELFRNENWFPLGGNDSNYGVVENQQSNPVAALVEKLTNSIDALLMRKCLEAGIDPKSSSAPRSVEEAVECFFPAHKNWDLSSARNAQAEAIQVVADSVPGDTSDTSLIIYDDGEGQHPSQFEATFLSLLRGNKNEIHFVQGKYNMGGSGAITFCGKHRYQLVASKRYDGSGPFGFTLIRRHPLTQQEQFTKKNTWYEYLKLDGAIPAFDIGELDLRLFNRRFTTGTVIKLYSYELSGNRHIRRDLGRSLNEFLYEPALPVYLVERQERYPNDRALHGVMFGLKRQLEGENDYVEETFSERVADRTIGDMKVTVHVFRTRAKGKDIAETRRTIQNEYFKNNMVVLFSLHGQVHGHYTSEFVTRTLKYNLLRDYLLIHVDCTNMSIDFRNELFMASRDRLKQGEESAQLRRVLADSLTSGRLGDVYRRRKSAISVESAEDDTLLRTFAEQLPISVELRQLLNQTFKLKDIQAQPKSKPSPRPDDQHRPERPPFYSKRFPTFFKLDVKQQEDRPPVLEIPLGGSRVVRFQSDVENEYFDRAEDPGDLRIAVLDYVPNDERGGDRKGTANQISDIFSVNRKSPADGTIKIVLSPTHDVCVGDEAQIRVDLTNPAGEDFTQAFWVRIAKPAPNEERKGRPEPEQVGLPQLIRVYERAPEGDNQDVKSWADVASIFEMDYDVVMHPLVEGDKLDAIYVNMDSAVLKRHKAGLRNPSAEQLQLADRRYVTGVYFHTLFLYAITKNLRYRLLRESEPQDVDVDLTDYLKDLFRNQYASFLLNFEVGGLMEGLG